MLQTIRAEMVQGALTRRQCVNCPYFKNALNEGDTERARQLGAEALLFCATGPTEDGQCGIDAMRYAGQTPPIQA